jgi:hypothetical protein
MLVTVAVSATAPPLGGLWTLQLVTQCVQPVSGFLLITARMALTAKQQ